METEKQVMFLSVSENWGFKNGDQTSPVTPKDKYSPFE